MANKPYYIDRHDFHMADIATEMIFMELIEQWVIAEPVDDIRQGYIDTVKIMKLRLRQKRQDYYKMYGQFPSAIKLREVASQEKKYYGLDK